VGVFHFHSKIDTRPTLVVTSIILWRLELQKSVNQNLILKHWMCLGMGMVVEPTTSARELEGSNWMMDPEKEQVRTEEE
jgi:hypothetical protein